MKTTNANTTMMNSLLQLFDLFTGALQACAIIDFVSSGTIQAWFASSQDLYPC
jgi:hypothetical protein